MSATLTVKQYWTDGKRQHVVGTLALTGNYTTGGIPLGLLVDGIFTSQSIVHSDVTGRGGYYGFDIGTLYEYRYVPAPYQSGIGAPANFLSEGTLRIFESGTEISAGALPSGVTEDTVFFYGIFQKF